MARLIIFVWFSSLVIFSTQHDLYIYIQEHLDFIAAMHNIHACGICDMTDVNVLVSPLSTRLRVVLWVTALDYYATIYIIWQTNKSVNGGVGLFVCVWRCGDANGFSSTHKRDSYWRRYNAESAVLEMNEDRWMWMRMSGACLAWLLWPTLSVRVVVV